MGDVWRGVDAAARARRFHPVRQHFEDLDWDGVPRINTWLTTYLGATECAYVRAVGPRWLIAGAARIYQPGCQCDHTLTLEGRQGLGKSKALRLLAIRPEWFTDRLSHLGSKDAAMEAGRGAFIIEIAELELFARVASSTAKAFLTRREDRIDSPTVTTPTI